MDLGTPISNAVGNRVWIKENSIKTEFTYNVANQIVSSIKEGEIITFNYDNNGNLIKKIDISGTTEYNYDLDNRLIEVKTSNGNINKFGYGSNNLQLWMENSNGKKHNLHDGISVLSEYDESGLKLIWYNNDIENIDRYLSKKIGNEKYYYHQDHLGSIIKITGKNGNVHNSYTYGVWGDLFNKQGSVDVKYLWTGRKFHKEIDLQYNRARYYQPKLGRFIQEDSLASLLFESSFEPFQNILALNKYVYTDNNPVNYTDFSGYYKSIKELFMKAMDMFGLLVDLPIFESTVQIIWSVVSSILFAKNYLKLSNDYTDAGVIPLWQHLAAAFLYVIIYATVFVVSILHMFKVVGPAVAFVVGFSSYLIVTSFQALMLTRAAKYDLANQICVDNY